MTDPILLRARELCIAYWKDNGFSPDLIRQAGQGWFDNGSYITRWIPQAEIEALRDRKEATDVE